MQNNFSTMNEQFNFEYNYNNLIGNHVLVYVQAADLENKDMAIFVRAKVLAAHDENVVVEFEGNDNILFDGQTDTVPVTHLATRLPKDNEPQGVQVFIVEEKGDRLYDSNGKVVHPGKWIEIKEEN